MAQRKKARPVRTRHVTKTKTKTKTTPRTARSVALVARPRPTAVVVPEREPSLVLGDEANIGTLGLAELRLTDQEEAVLARPVDINHVLVKPTGEAYLSHPYYTRLFNESFGRLGWSLRPVSKPMAKDGLVVCPYVLYIHGVPVAHALGEQEYSATNARQSYGDAIESTVASALRRCAKRLGVALELWDKQWLHRFEAEHVIKVKVTTKKGGEEREEYWFRRRDDPPFWQEQKAQRASYGQSSRPAASAPPAPAQPRTSQHPHETQPITDPQRKRLFTIAKHHGRSEVEIKAYLLKVYKIGSTRDLQRKDYDAVISALEASGPLGGGQADPPLVGEVLTADDLDFRGGRS